MLNHLMPALFVLVATMLQMFLSLKEVSAVRKEALEHKNAEDQLIAELPRMKRLRARRDLIRDRDQDVHRAIREAWLHVLAWALLFGAASSATFTAATGS